MTTMTDRAEVMVPPKLFRVGEIAQHTGLSRQTLHNYTTMGLIKESDYTPGGHRLYDETVFHRLHRISQLKESHNMRQVLRLMRDGQDGEIA